jgi:cell surface protein SprA
MNSPLWVFINFQTPIIEQDSLQERVNRTTPFKPYDEKIYVPYRVLERSEINVLRKKYPPEGLYKYIDIDSNGNTVRFRTEFDDNTLSYPYDIELDDYLEIRKKQIVNNYWDSLGTSYDLSKALSGGDLARMISQATGLTIPIPPNPLSGIFGKPEININVSGEVNLRLGWRWDSQNLGTVSAFGQTQSSPVFNQDIRVNVTGGIGDKLKLGTDWNTRRQFEYDNKFKIGYEGEDDEIIKLIEVGNVSLPTTSTLIGGGQALFGARADFQFGPLYHKTIASQRRGERKFVEARG